MQRISKQYKVRPKCSARGRIFNTSSAGVWNYDKHSLTYYLQNFLEKHYFYDHHSTPSKVTINLPYFCWLNSLFTQEKEKGFVAKLCLIKM